MNVKCTVVERKFYYLLGGLDITAKHYFKS